MKKFLATVFMAVIAFTLAVASIVRAEEEEFQIIVLDNGEVICCVGRACGNCISHGGLLPSDDRIKRAKKKKAMSDKIKRLLGLGDVDHTKKEKVENKKAHIPKGMVYVKQENGGFYIDMTLVTQKEYQRVIGSNPSGHKGCRSCPVEQVTWFEADAYCKKVGKRLPTEDEWEYAATSGGKYDAWAGTSDESKLADYAWYGENSGGKTHPVGKKKPNGLGLYDMCGNVWEWTDSWNDDKKKERVLRGGSWNFMSILLYTEIAIPYSPASRDDDFGFRCAQ